MCLFCPAVLLAAIIYTNQQASAELPCSFSVVVVFVFELDSFIQVVLKCGKMAVNFEHSFSDGMDWTRMLSEVDFFVFCFSSRNISSYICMN